MHGLTKEDLKGPSLNIFKPSDKDAERVEYVVDTVLICYMLSCMPHRDSLYCCHNLLSKEDFLLTCST